MCYVTVTVMTFDIHVIHVQLRCSVVRIVTTKHSAYSQSVSVSPSGDCWQNPNANLNPKVLKAIQLRVLSPPWKKSGGYL